MEEDEKHTAMQEEYMEGIEVDPGTVLTNLELKLLMEEDEKHTAMQEEYMEGIEVDPGTVLTNLELKLLMEEDEKHTAMQEEYMEGIEVDPGTVLTNLELKSQLDDEECCDTLLEDVLGDMQDEEEEEENISLQNKEEEENLSLISGFSECKFSSLDSETHIDDNDHCHILTLLPSNRSLRRKTWNSKSFSDQENTLNQQMEKNANNVDYKEQCPFLNDSRPLKAFPCSMQEKRDIRKSRISKDTKIIFLKSWKISYQKSWRRFCEEGQNIFSSVLLWKTSISDIEVCYNYSLDKRSEPIYMHILGIFSGTGYFESSYLFYGGYTLPLTRRYPWYNLTMAYMLTVLAYLLFCFIWIVRRAILGLKQHRMDHRRYKILQSIKIFAAWDFCIRDLNTASVKQRSISNDLKLDFEEEQRHINKANMPLKQKVLIYILRIIMHLLIMALLIGSFYAICKAKDISELKQRELASYDQNNILVLILAYLPSAVITISNFILPKVFNMIVKYEGYSPSWENNLTLIRSVFLRLASLGMFFFSMWQQITCGGNREDKNCATCGYNKADLCWETKVGQELYRLIIFHFISTVCGIFLIGLPRKRLFDLNKGKVMQIIGKPVFLIPENVLDIVYGQTIMWSGMFYCPLFPFINCIKFFLIFYINKFSLYHICTPSKRLFRVSSCNVFFQFALLLGLVVSSVPVIYSISMIHPSHACGPFRTLTVIWKDVMTEQLSSLPGPAKDCLSYITSNTFAISLVVLLSLMLTHYISQSKVNNQTIEQLKVHLKMQSHDKLYLVRYYSSIVRQQKMRHSIRDKTLSFPSLSGPVQKKVVFSETE
ncbi:transmembrane channel-like protein 8 isoform X2 [Protopterus annectens]|nr:transmembrane channel-like protein 8 isoform X2 [Protopterus annectens]